MIGFLSLIQQNVDAYTAELKVSAQTSSLDTWGFEFNLKMIEYYLC